MECEVLLRRTEELIDIVWAFQSSETTFRGILRGSGNKYTITEGFSSPLTQRSRLRVDFLNDDDAGWYACQIRFLNGTFARASQALQLGSSNIFRGRVSPCSPFEAQSVREETCALEGNVGDGIDLFDTSKGTVSVEMSLAQYISIASGIAVSIFFMGQ